MIFEHSNGLGEQKCKRCGVVVDVAELVQLPLGGGQICEACDSEETDGAAFLGITVDEFRNGGTPWNGGAR